MKDLKTLKGVKTLSKNEQKLVKGGDFYCTPTPEGCFCPMYTLQDGNICIDGSGKPPFLPFPKF